jgi:hypothetical protein
VRGRDRPGATGGTRLHARSVPRPGVGGPRPRSPAHR